MGLILNIETATENASVCLSRDGQILAFEESTDQKNHASFLHPAIQQLFISASLIHLDQPDGSDKPFLKYALSSLDAIAVSNGPGSYTGLRVGLSAAKGLCYALNKPLILINTLEVMAYASLQENQGFISAVNREKPVLFCPMIDARRMEVFTALYDAALNIIKEPAALILNEDSFRKERENNQIIFSGSGSNKLLSFGSVNLIIDHCVHNATHLAVLADKAYAWQHFADLAYSEPYYIKAFFSTQNKTV